MEIQDLIYLVCCAINGEKPDPERVNGMDLDAIYTLSSRHKLTGAVAPALMAAGVKDARFDAALKHTALKNAQMDMEMEALFAELNAAGIWYMPLKGIVIQHLYPVYGMRKMSDHDILFDAQRADDVRAIMEGLGFTTKNFGNRKHDVYEKEPVSNYEMHRELFNPNAGKLYEYYRDLDNRLLGDSYEKHFSPEDFYLYVTAHDFIHHSTSGTGLRSLLDTYMYLQKTQLDMAYVTAEAEKMGLTEYEADIRSLSLHLFSGETLTERDRQMLGYTLSPGMSGAINNKVDNGMQKANGSRIRYAMSRFFVPISKKNKRYAEHASAYPFFYRHRILLPFLPFYRTFRAIKRGRFQLEAKAIKNAK